MVFNDLVTEKNIDLKVCDSNGGEICFHARSCEMTAAMPPWFVLDTSLVGRSVSRCSVIAFFVCHVSVSRNMSKFSSSMRVAIVTDLFPMDCAFNKLNIIDLLLLVVDTGEIAFMADDLADVNIRCHLVLAC